MSLLISRQHSRIITDDVDAGATVTAVRVDRSPRWPPGTTWKLEESSAAFGPQPWCWVHEGIHQSTHIVLLHSFHGVIASHLPVRPQWGAADAEIKVASGENTELKHFPFKACSRSVYSHRCHAYCQGFLSLPISTLPVHSPAFFPKPLPISPVLAVANAWFLCRPAE